MIDQHGNYVCDYCTSINGEFYDETGNHVGCQDAAGPIAALREALQKIANGNPGRPNWLTDIEMAEIARAALAKLDGAK
jgi:hypothetical protein